VIRVLMRGNTIATCCTSYTTLEGEAQSIYAAQHLLSYSVPCVGTHRSSIVIAEIPEESAGLWENDELRDFFFFGIEIIAFFRTFGCHLSLYIRMIG
jgi:hypothetical protein